MRPHAGILVGAACASALAGGAIVAGALFLIILVEGFAPGPGGEIWPSVLIALVFMAYSGAVATFVYFVGALVAGLPTFLILDHAGWTTPIHAFLAGAALSGLVALFLTKGEISWLPMVGLAAAGGAVAGLVFRRVAYRRD